MDLNSRNIELWLNRQLDGMLTEQQASLLQAYLNQDEEARILYEKMQRTDVLCATAIREDFFEASATPVLSAGVACVSPRWMRSLWGWVPAAMAACLLLWVSWGMAGGPVATQVAGLYDPQPSQSENAVLVSSQEPRAVTRPVHYPSPQMTETTRLNYYGLYDEAKKELYLLELREQEDALRKAPPRRTTDDGRVVLASGRL